MKTYAYNFEIMTMMEQFVAAFNQIVINRYDESQDAEGNIIRNPKGSVRVRYVYAPKHKLLYDIVDKQQNMTLPVVGVYPTAIVRDATRSINKRNTYNAGVMEYKQPIPINVELSLSIATKYQTDMDQIISSIVTYCEPYLVIQSAVPYEYTNGREQQLKIEAEWNNNISVEYPVEQAANKLVEFMATTSFTLRGFLFKPQLPTSNVYVIDSNFIPIIENSDLNLPVSAFPDAENIPVSGIPQIKQLNFNGVRIFENPSIPLGVPLTAYISGPFISTMTSAFLSADNIANSITITDYALSGIMPPANAYTALAFEKTAADTASLVIPAASANHLANIILVNEGGWYDSKQSLNLVIDFN